MRIAYVNILVEPKPGIENRISAQADALDRVDADEFDFYVINLHEERAEGRIHYVRLSRNSPVKWSRKAPGGR